MSLKKQIVSYEALSAFFITNLINNINYQKINTDEKIYKGIVKGKFSEKAAQECHRFEE